MQQLPKDNTVPGEWTTGLWGCFSDWGNCITTLFCPCITYGQVSNIVNQGKASVYHEARIYATIMYFTFGCSLYSCFNRSKLRHTYKLPKSPRGCPDFLVHLCCEPCALCQEYRELQNREFDMAIGYDLNRPQDPPKGQIMNNQQNTLQNENNQQNVLQNDNQEEHQ